MEIPEPNDYAKDHGHNPFPPRWGKWLSQARQAILAAQPQAGRHVTTDEHPGKGTVINIDDTSARRPGGGGPPGPGACCVCDDTITTLEACEAAGGHWQTEAGCDFCFICDDTITTEGACIDAGGTWHPGASCADDPCAPVVCPTAEQVQLVFEGVDVFACSCVDTSGVGGVSDVAIQSTTDFGINATFILNQVSDDPGQIVYEQLISDVAGLVGYNFWSSLPNDCSTPSDGNNRSDTIIRLTCLKNDSFLPAGVYIEMEVTNGHYITFFGYEASSATITNATVCNTCPSADWFSCPLVTAIAENGSVTWSEL